MKMSQFKKVVQYIHLPVEDFDIKIKIGDKLYDPILGSASVIGLKQDIETPFFSNSASQKILMIAPDMPENEKIKSDGIKSHKVLPIITKENR